MVLGELRFTTYSVKDYNTSVGTLVYPGIWQHVTAVLDSDNDVSFYVNGEFKTKVLHTLPGNVDTTDVFLIGAGTSLSSTDLIGLFDGAMDDVRIYNRALSATEVKRLYELGGGSR